jgi:hypothetical protein
MFIIWLNPEVTFQANSNNTGTYTIKTQIQGASDPEPGSLQGVDSLAVTAKDLVNGTVEVTTLQPQRIWNANKQAWYDVPGLASVCKNLYVAEYQAHQCTQADQCGCQISDWAGILAQDPLLNYTNTQSVLNANTSPPSQCSGGGLNANSKCRYVYIGQTSLQGPQCLGCDIPVNSNVWTDSTTGTYTLNESTSQTTGYSWSVHFAPGGAGPTITDQETLTETSTESTGTINGYAHSAQLTLQSSTTYCNEPVLVYMDTTYHTFLFQEETNGTCP